MMWGSFCEQTCHLQERKNDAFGRHFCVLQTLSAFFGFWEFMFVNLQILQCQLCIANSAKAMNQCQWPTKSDFGFLIFAITAICRLYVIDHCRIMIIIYACGSVNWICVCSVQSIVCTIHSIVYTVYYTDSVLQNNFHRIIVARFGPSDPQFSTHSNIQSTRFKPRNVHSIARHLCQLWPGPFESNGMIQPV